MFYLFFHPVDLFYEKTIERYYSSNNFHSQIQTIYNTAICFSSLNDGPLISAVFSAFNTILINADLSKNCIYQNFAEHRKYSHI